MSEQGNVTRRRGDHRRRVSFLLAWGEFLFAVALTTSTDVQPLTVALAKFSLPIVAVFIGLQRYIVGGLTLGGIKE
jgi:multiple sugar transport system permease protein